MKEKRVDGLNDDDTEFELHVSEEETRIRSRKTLSKKQSGSAPWFYLGFIGEIGFAIAGPIAGGAVLGVIIDRTWSTTPKATLLLLFLGVMISFINLFKTVETIIQKK